MDKHHRLHREWLPHKKDDDIILHLLRVDQHFPKHSKYHLIIWKKDVRIIYNLYESQNVRMRIEN